MRDLVLRAMSHIYDSYKSATSYFNEYYSLDTELKKTIWEYYMVGNVRFDLTRFSCKQFLELVSFFS